jgi:hypothetical protein
MDIAGWIATVVAAWVTLSVPVALVIGKIISMGRDPQVQAMGQARLPGLHSASEQLFGGPRSPLMAVFNTATSRRPGRAAR